MTASPFPCLAQEMVESWCEVPSLLSQGTAQENLFHSAWGNWGDRISVAVTRELWGGGPLSWT